MFIVLLITLVAKGQYTKEKITGILTGGSEKTWQATGINTEISEKTFSFSKTNEFVLTKDDENIKKDKWSLTSPDNIRWFLNAGGKKYEMIISYDKKGNQYIKLTHREDGKSSEYYEIKLTPAK
jgi:hypothetical protein